jgi:hypothetical protein
MGGRMSDGWQDVPAEPISGGWENVPKAKPQTAYDRFLNAIEIPKFENRIAGPMAVSGAGELIKGAGGALELLAPETGQNISRFGETLTNKVKEQYPVAGTTGQVGSYALPFAMAQKGVNAVKSIPAISNAVSKIPSYATALAEQSAIGGGTGALLTPTSEGRGESAAFGALGGAGGELIKPIVKVGGNILAEGLGALSGVGSQAYKTAYNSAVQGGDKLKALAENLRKKVPVTQVVDDALLGLTNMGKDLQAKYRSGMVNIKNDKSILGFDTINDALIKAEEMGKFRGQVTNPKVAENIAKAQQAVSEWKALSPAEYHTPEGMDALKKTIGGILEDIPFEQKTARSAVGDIYTAVKQSISKQAPAYDNVMKNYSEGLETAKELKRALNLGEKSSTDSALRRLQSVMRNDVNTNYGNRVDYGNMLEQASGKPIMSELAGQSLSSPLPRGLQKLLPSATGGGAIAASNPWLLATLPLQSPRLMGEASILAGKASRPVINLANSGTPEQRKMAKLLIMRAAQQGASNE